MVNNSFVIFRRTFLLKQILIGLLLSFVISQDLLATEKNDAKKLAADVDSFKQMMISKHGFSDEELTAWFSTVTTDKVILKKISRPAEAAMPWHRYRNIFIQQERVDKGIIFWNKYNEALVRAENTYGVPINLIVGLIGVETKYGRIKGKDDVFNSLYTLAFHFPRRAKFFRSELKEFLLLAREQEWPVGSIKGSYAGAMGYGQFMPSSYRQYAVDFDNDGKINLLSNPVDAIGSVANYIKVHGWKKGETIAHKASVEGTGFNKVLSRKLKPTKTVAELSAAGVKFDGEIDKNKKAILIALKQKEGMEYWIGMHNFYVISRYNPRTLYTMAVTQLSELIQIQQQANLSRSK